MNATRNARASLWEKAIALPEARDSDFFGPRRRPSGVSDEHLKIITDTSLRTRLIETGIAEGLQSPKGPQRIPSILRLYPNFDAPAKGSKPGPGGRPPGLRAVDTPRSAYGLPTVEELDDLLERIEIVETAVSAELAGEVNAEIARLKSDVGRLDGEEFEAAFAALDAALRKRREISAHVREMAFARIEDDTDFEPRKYLRLIARSPRV